MTNQNSNGSDEVDAAVGYEKRSFIPIARQRYYTSLNYMKLPTDSTDASLFYLQQNCQHIGDTQVNVYVEIGETFYNESWDNNKWKESFEKAIQEINLAAPGLHLQTERTGPLVIKVEADKKNDTARDINGSILADSKIATISLGKNEKSLSFNDKDRIAVRTIFQALGFQLEHKRSDADSQTK